MAKKKNTYSGETPRLDTTTLGAGSLGAKPLASKRFRKRKVRTQSNNKDAHSATLITRRNLLFGAAGAGVLAAGIAGTRMLSSSEETDDDIATLNVEEDTVFDLESCAEVDAGDAFDLIGNFELPFGTLVWADDDEVAACLFPTEDPTPLVHMGLLHLGSGNYFTLREEAVGAAEGFEIYDVRASSSGLIWMESAVMEGLWRIYVAPLSAEYVLGEAHLVDSGNATQEVPTITVANNYAFWQTMAPITNENARREPSSLKRADLKTGEAKTLYNAFGRMSAPPVPYGSSVIFTPRHEDALSYCDLVRINAESGAIEDRLTLPSGMFPNQVGYGPVGFSFCFESIYDYGGGIHNLGTYTPAAKHKSGIYEDMEWFRFNRTPTAAPCWCSDKWFMVKSNQSVCAVNLPNKIFCSFGVESGCLDWGDFLVSSGMRDTVVTSMQIDQVNNEGEETRITQVRVWQPLGSIPQNTEVEEGATQDNNDTQDEGSGPLA